VDAASTGDVIKIATGTYTDVHGRLVPAGYGYPPPSGIITQVVYITKTVTIRGGYTAPGFADPPNPDANPTTLDAQGEGRVLFIAGSISPVIEGLRITGGDAASLYGGIGFDAGGGIYIDAATAIISNSQIFSNTAGRPYSEGEGGGLYLHHSDATISRNMIVSNTADMLGGGLFLRYSNADLSGNIIRGNMSGLSYEGGGGGICLFSSDASVRNNLIQDNVGGKPDDSVGGGVYVSSSSANIISNTFRGNIASVEGTGFGGGLYTSRSPATIIDNTFVSNTASIASAGSGGGLMLSYNSPATVTNNIIHDNVGSTVSSGYGGGIRVWGSPALIQDNTIYNNVASTVSSGYGGGISVYNSPATLTNNKVATNTASTTGFGYGGGLHVNSSNATLSHNTVTGNAAYGGGGIYLSYSDNVLIDNLVQRNIASGRGGGLSISGRSPLLINTVVADNILDHTAAVGAGIHLSYASPRLVHTTIARNTGGDGSGVYVTGFEWSGTYYSSTVWLTNTILVSHTVGITVSAGDTANLNSTLWHDNGLDWDGAGTINRTNDHSGDAAFAADGYHLTGKSAAINQGINAGVTTDIDDNNRPQGLGYDLGADEWLCSTALTDVDITGPTAGYTGTTYTLDAVIAPSDASEPITFAWSPEPSSGQGTENADYKWATPGVYSITLEAGNCGGIVSDTHTILISADTVATVDPDKGGTLVYTDTQGSPTVVQVLPGAVSNTITLVYTPVGTATAPSGFAFAGHAFDLEAYRGGSLLPGFVFEKPVTITLHYSDGDVAGIDEASLVLNYWDGSAWVDAAATCTPPATYDRHPEANWLAVPVCHLSRFALFGQAEMIEYNVYLPLVMLGK